MPRNSGTTRAEIASWVDVVCQTLVESRWGPVIRASGVDALDALRSPIYLRFAQLVDISGEPGRSDRGPTASLVRRAVARADLMASEYKARALTAPAKAVPVVFWPRD